MFPIILRTFLRLNRTFSPNFLNCLRTFSPNFFQFHRTFSPNFHRLQCTFRGYYLPCWPPPQQVSFRILLSSNYRMWYRKKSLPFDIMFFARQKFISIYMYSNWVNISAMTFVSRYLYSYSLFYTHIQSQT